MPEIRPFCGIRYNPEKLNTFADVTTQPYDQISETMEKAYKQASPYNFVRLILTKESAGHDRTQEYQDAKRFSETWLKDGIFIQDKAPAVYPYFQTFSMDNKEYCRKGLVALLKLEELGKGSILPHERTLSKPKEDRLNLMRTTRKNFEYVFMLYTDPANEIDGLIAPQCQKIPLIHFKHKDNIKHQLWSITDSQLIGKISDKVRNSIMVIADGHHRYETSFSYCEEQKLQNSKHTGAEPYNYRLVALVNIEDPGLVILPTHRLIKNLKDFDLRRFIKDAEKYFDVQPSDESKISHDLSAAKEKAFGLYSSQGVFLLKLKDAGIMGKTLAGKTREYQNLDVVILHTLLIEHTLKIKPEEIENHVKYERGIDKAIEHVKKGEFQFCFLMNPTKPSQVRDVAQQRERMPQKSTDFYPKMLSGLVFYDLAG